MGGIQCWSDELFCQSACHRLYRSEKDLRRHAGRRSVCPAGVGGDRGTVRARVLSPHHPDVLRAFRRRSPADSAVGSSAPPGSHAAPPPVIVILSEAKNLTTLAPCGERAG